MLAVIVIGGVVALWFLSVVEVAVIVTVVPAGGEVGAV
jgi:hypothetical protein